MSSPFLQILERNLNVPDVDRSSHALTVKKQRAKGIGRTSQPFIDGYWAANALVQSGMSRLAAVKIVSRKHNIGFSNLYNHWARIEAEAIKQGEDHGE